MKTIFIFSLNDSVQLTGLLEWPSRRKNLVLHNGKIFIRKEWRKWHRLKPSFLLLRHLECYVVSFFAICGNFPFNSSKITSLTLTSSFQNTIVLKCIQKQQLYKNMWYATALVCNANFHFLCLCSEKWKVCDVDILNSFSTYYFLIIR